MKERIHIIGNGTTVKKTLNIGMINSNNDPVILINQGALLAPWFDNVLFIGFRDQITVAWYYQFILSQSYPNNDKMKKLMYENFRYLEVKYNNFEKLDHMCAGAHCIRETMNKFKKIHLYGFDVIPADIFEELNDSIIETFRKDYHDLGILNNSRFIFHI